MTRQQYPPPRPRPGAYGPPQQAPYGQAPQGAYGYQNPQDPYAYYAQQGVDPWKIATGALGALAILLFIGVLVIWSGKATAEDKLATKRNENNDLRREKDSLTKENAFSERKLLSAGPDGFPDDPGNPTQGSAEHWKALCEDIEKQRDNWRQLAHDYRSKLSLAEKDFMHQSEHISIPDKYIREESDDAGARWVCFRVISKAPVKLSNLVGSIGFYQNGTLAHEEPFMVKKIDPEETVEMRIAVPDRIIGYFEVAGHIKAAGR